MDRSVIVALLLGCGVSLVPTTTTTTTRTTTRRRTRFLRCDGRVCALSEEAARNEIERRNVAVETTPEGALLEAEEEEAAAAALEAVTSGELGSAALVVERSLQAVDDISKASTAVHFDRRRIVVLGSGWGAASLVKALGGAARYDDVTVVSPRNYFLFTPMLAGAAVGTVDYRSITEPLRRLNGRVNYLEATALRIDVERRVVECEAVACEGTSCEITDFDVPYDVVACAVGATTNTFGVKGVREHCLFLKQIQDAEALRRAVGNVFERASFPAATETEKRRALSFVVVGAGPTGVEFCSELRDFLNSEATRFYPDLLEYAQVTLLEATTTVLGAFDASLRDVALDELCRERRAPEGERILAVDVRLGAAVREVNQTHVMIGDLHESIPYGLCVWATGNGPVRVVSDSIDEIGTVQKDAQSRCRGRLAVDSHLRVLGTPRGEVFALGDCAAFPPSPLPATAQVAAQQGEYLARLFASGYDLSQPTPSRKGPKLGLGEAFCETTTEGRVLARGFQFLDLGILTYVGDSKALAQLGLGGTDSKFSIKGSGRIAFALWRSVYLAKQMSIRNRLSIGIDWVRNRVFGRDITRF
ncbi:hypothetical protein CTAYLR_002317 [Chrysophaeum taylorii]|uniref:Uncharacterized protein n=1 Tax=Chrysophaeum taylorii TaxID=2483200 RepID=A0AAD7UNY5_9STRA|nr:hypothetical protein CTAYLR_002317 [Chrysophaeum taylorii]